MLPYIPQPVLDLGPLSLHAFGVLVAAAVLVGSWLFERRAARVGLDAGVAKRLTGWILVSGFLGAHLVERFFYSFEETLANPLSILYVWEGISSFGGFLGAIVGAVLFFRASPQGRATWRYLDALAVVFPAAWVIGRLGCFLAYDHVGRETSAFIGQMYTDGIVRHNLGLEEAMFSAAVAVIMAGLARVQRPPGQLVGLLAVLYAPGRFLLDFLRVSDERYMGLLVSQYGSIALFVAGLALVLWSLSRQKDAAAETSADAVTPGEVVGFDYTRS